MSRSFTVCERETRIAIKEGARTIAYVQMSADDEEVANLFAAAPDLLALAKQYASECGDCDGKGYVTGRGPDDVIPNRISCEQCADIRAVIAKAVTP